MSMIDGLAEAKNEFGHIGAIYKRADGGFIIAVDGGEVILDKESVIKFAYMLLGFVGETVYVPLKQGDSEKLKGIVTYDQVDSIREHDISKEKGRSDFVSQLESLSSSIVAGNT